MAKTFSIKRVPFFVRLGEVVGRAIALSVGRFPVLIRLEGVTDGGLASVTACYEVGVTVTVRLFNLSSLDGNDREHWVVYAAQVKHYPPTSRSSETVSQVVEELDPERLIELQNAGGWYHPDVMDPDQILGSVGIFVDNAAHNGFVRVDPDRNQEGHYTERASVPYRVLVPGDKERAFQEARTILAEYTR